MIEVVTIQPRWLTLESARKYSGLSEGTLRKLIKSGDIVSSNAIPPGSSKGMRLIDRPSLDAWIEKFIGGKNELAMNSGKGGRDE